MAVIVTSCAFSLLPIHIFRSSLKGFCKCYLINFSRSRKPVNHRCSLEITLACRPAGAKTMTTAVLHIHHNIISESRHILGHLFSVNFVIYLHENWAPQVHYLSYFDAKFHKGSFSRLYQDFRNILAQASMCLSSHTLYT